MVSAPFFTCMAARRAACQTWVDIRARERIRSRSLGGCYGKLHVGRTRGRFQSAHIRADRFAYAFIEPDRDRLAERCGPHAAAPACAGHGRSGVARLLVSHESPFSDACPDVAGAEA